MRLAEILRKYRIHSERSVRSLAEEIGLPSATYSRVERGEQMDGHTLALILSWLIRPVEM